MPLKPSNLTLQKMSQGEAYNNFASSIRSHSTLKTYRYRLAQYAERIRKTADLDQIIADDLLNPKQAEKYIKQFIASMKATRLTEVYVSGNCAALRHFYDMNDVVLNWRKLTRFQNGGMPGHNLDILHEILLQQQ